MQLPLEKIFLKLRQRNLDALLVPSWDEWGSQMMPMYRNRLFQATGFTGSHGLAVLGTKGQSFFTDGRYTQQANIEVNKEFFAINTYNTDNIADFLTQNYSGCEVGFDPYVFSYKMVKLLEDKAPKVTFKATDDLFDIQANIDEIKHNLPEIQLFNINDKYAGQSTADKKAQIFEDLRNFDHIVITEPATISWLFNLRALEEGENYSLAVNVYCILHRDGADCFYLSPHMRFASGFDGVESKDISQITKDINALEASKIYITENTPYAVAEAVGVQNIQLGDRLALYKCIKNEVEQQNIIDVHNEDGALMTKFFEDLKTEYRYYDEYTVGMLLARYRSKLDHFITHSFPSIIACGSNASIIHYRAKPGSCDNLVDNKMILIDSGGHYKWGTTDITRTIKVGTPAAEEKLLFTKVLQGLINLSRHRFKHSTGQQLDAIARAPVQELGYNYNHSTGHGVGMAIDVHEGPIRLSSEYNEEITEGMVLSIEPGAYIEGQCGIRIENLALVEKDDIGWHYFRTLTMVPIQENMVDYSILSQDQRAWLENYNEQCVTNFRNYESLVKDIK